MIEHKAVPVGDLRVLDDEHGVVEAIVSVTGVWDEVNDLIEPGAYQKTLARRKPKGIWSHSWDTPISKTLDARELMPGNPELPRFSRDGLPWPKEAGALKVKMQFNLETQRGREAYADVKFFGSDAEWSVGYQVPVGQATMEAKATGQQGRRIKTMDLYEYSPVLFGAMPLAATTSMKSAQAALAAVRAVTAETETKGKKHPFLPAADGKCKVCGSDDRKAHPEAKDLYTDSAPTVTTAGFGAAMAPSRLMQRRQPHGFVGTGRRCELCGRRRGVGVHARRSVDVGTKTLADIDVEMKSAEIDELDAREVIMHMVADGTLDELGMAAIGFDELDAQVFVAAKALYDRLELKSRRVRTPEGSRLFKKPIGSEIHGSLLRVPEYRVDLAHDDGENRIDEVTSVADGKLLGEMRHSRLGSAWTAFNADGERHAEGHAAGPESAMHALHDAIADAHSEPNPPSGAIERHDLKESHVDVLGHSVEAMRREQAADYPDKVDAASEAFDAVRGGAVPTHEQLDHLVMARNAMSRDENQPRDHVAMVDSALTRLRGLANGNTDDYTTPGQEKPFSQPSGGGVEDYVANVLANHEGEPDEEGDDGLDALAGHAHDQIDSDEETGWITAETAAAAHDHVDAWLEGQPSDDGVDINAALRTNDESDGNEYSHAMNLQEAVNVIVDAYQDRDEVHAAIDANTDLSDDDKDQMHSMADEVEYDDDPGADFIDKHGAIDPADAKPGRDVILTVDGDYMGDGVIVDPSEADVNDRQDETQVAVRDDEGTVGWYYTDELVDRGGHLGDGENDRVVPTLDEHVGYDPTSEEAVAVITVDEDDLKDTITDDDRVTYEMRDDGTAELRSANLPDLANVLEAHGYTLLDDGSLDTSGTTISPYLYDEAEHVDNTFNVGDEVDVDDGSESDPGVPTLNRGRVVDATVDENGDPIGPDEVAVEFENGQGVWGVGFEALVRRPSDEKKEMHSLLDIVFGDSVETKAKGGVDKNRGGAEKLRRYWTHGEGAAKIGWGTPGDWARCVTHLSKYLGPRAKGYCNLRHHDATGAYPGHAPAEEALRAGKRAVRKGGKGGEKVILDTTSPDVVADLEQKLGRLLSEGKAGRLRVAVKDLHAALSAALEDAEADDDMDSLMEELERLKAGLDT